MSNLKICSPISKNGSKTSIWSLRALAFLCLALAAGFPLQLFATIPAAAKSDPRYKLGYLVVTYYPGVTNNGTGDSLTGLQTALDDAYTNDLVALFPAGTYLISDSIKCFQWWDWNPGGNTFAGGGPYFNSGYALLGSSLGTTRPVIKLMNSPTGNFDDTNNIRPLLVFRLFKQVLTNSVAGTQPTDPMGVPDKYDINTSSLFNCEVRNLDFDCNNHTGAVAVVFPAAQGSVIADVSINATNAYAGVYGLPGRHWGAVNLEVDGGSYGIYCGQLAGDVGAGSAIFGVKLYGQTVAAIDYNDFVSLVMVGFHITKSSNPVLTLNSASQTANNTMVLQDGIIEMDGGAPTTATLKNPNGDTFYARNIYVSGSTNLIKSSTLAALTGSGSWSRIDEYSYTDQTTNSGASGVYTTRSMVDGGTQTTAERVKVATANSGPPPVDLLERHLPPAGLPTYEGAGSPPTIVVTDPPYNAIPGDGTNDTLALQRAIDDASAAGHGRVFIPKFNTAGSFSGKFELTNTLVLHSNTMLFGAGKNGVSGLRTHGSWKPAKSVNMIQTDDRAAASTYLGNLELSTTNLYLYPFTAYEWRAGKSSSTFDLAINGDWISTITNPNTNNFVITRFSGNAGGRHYFFPQTSGMAGNTVSNINYRNVQIIGTTQPLWFYGFNLEGGKQDTRSEDMDIFNAANIRLLGWKREGRASMVVVSNSQNLVLYAAGAMRDYPPDPGVGEIEITGTSSNIMMANLLVQFPGSSGPYGLTVMETITGQGSNSVPYPEGVSLYKRGTIDEALMQLPPGAPTGLTAAPVSSVQVNLAWEEVPGETGWLVERKLGTNAFNQLAVIGGGITNYSDTSVMATNTYTYRVSATNAAGASPPSLPVTVTTPLSANAYLKGLVLNPAGTLSPSFTTNGFSYLATNAYGNSPTLTVTNADVTATNKYSLNGGLFKALTNSMPSGVLTLGVGSTNLLNVLVTAQDGVTTNLYTVNLTMLPPPLSTNAFLTAIALSPAGTLSPNFTTNGFSYVATNAYGSMPTVTVTNADATASNKYSLNGGLFKALTNGVASSPLTLGVGSTNVLKVVVTAQDGVTTNLYTVNMTMLPNTNALLSNLTLSTGGLTPSIFASGTLNYTATNAYVSNPVQVTATSADANATLQLKLNGGGYTSLTSSVASGSQTLVLNPPLNTLAVKVTAQDGVTTNLYTMNVLLQPSVAAFRLTNGVSGGTNLVLSWPLDHTGYRLLTQTNNLNQGISGNMADWGTVANYAATNTATIPILATNLNQYFRLVYP